MFCTALSLTMHILLAKGQTQNYYQSVCVGRASFAESGKHCSKHLLRVCFMDNLAFALGLGFFGPHSTIFFVEIF